LSFGDSFNGGRSYKLLRWEYGYVLVVLFPLINVRGSGEDIQPCIGFAGYVMDNKVVFLQIRMPPGYSLVEVLWCLPVLEVRMVHEDDKGELGLSQVVSPVG
jgi:hypothetical protein